MRVAVVGLPITTILVIAFPLIKIVMQGQQPHVCQTGCKYLISFIQSQKLQCNNNSCRCMCLAGRKIYIIPAATGLEIDIS